VNKVMVLLASTLISLALCTPAFPWVAEHPAQLPVGGATGWPAGLRELVNREGRVYGYFINANDFFFFTGDTESFNDFLEQYARLKGTPLTLIVHPGRGITSRLGEKEKKITFDWEVEVLCRGWHPQAPPDPTRDPRTDKPGYVVILEVWVGGNVELKKVKVPKTVKMKSGGEIEKFIAGHRAKQERGKESE